MNTFSYRTTRPPKGLLDLPTSRPADSQTADGREQAGERRQLHQQAPPFLLTLPEVARLLSLGTTKTYDLIRSGSLESVTIGRCRRVSRAALERFVLSLTEDGFGEAS